METLSLPSITVTDFPDIKADAIDHIVFLQSLAALTQGKSNGLLGAGSPYFLFAEDVESTMTEVVDRSFNAITHQAGIAAMSNDEKQHVLAHSLFLSVSQLREQLIASNLILENDLSEPNLSQIKKLNGVVKMNERNARRNKERQDEAKKEAERLAEQARVLPSVEAESVAPEDMSEVVSPEEVHQMAFDPKGKGRDSDQGEESDFSEDGDDEDGLPGSGSDADVLLRRAQEEQDQVKAAEEKARLALEKLERERKEAAEAEKRAREAAQRAEQRDKPGAPKEKGASPSLETFTEDSLKEIVEQWVNSIKGINPAVTLKNVNAVVVEVTGDTELSVGWGATKQKGRTQARLVTQVVKFLKSPDNNKGKLSDRPAQKVYDAIPGKFKQ